MQSLSAREQESLEAAIASQNRQSTLGDAMREMVSGGAVQVITHSDTLIITGEAWNKIIARADEMAQAMESALKSKLVRGDLREELEWALHPHLANRKLGGYYIKDGKVWEKSRGTTGVG